MPRVKNKNEEYYVDGVFSNKKYYQANKERLLQRVGEKVECECGAIVRRDKCARHKRSAKHTTRMELFNDRLEREVERRLEELAMRQAEVENDENNIEN
jgi:hypothetical protein